MHEAGHYSLTGSIPLDRQLQMVTYGLGCGMSACYWRNQHNKHHATPQKEGHDMDLDTTPLVAFFDRAVETNRPRPHSRLWLRFQAWTFLPVTSGLFVMAFWVLFLHPRQVGKARDGAQALWMLAFHVVRPLLVAWAAGCSFFQGYAFTWASIWLSGMYLFGHFATSHTHLDVVPGDEHRNWVRYAVDHTVDISPDNPLVNWAMGYLNCQVIHHLFPQMPQCVQPEVSRRFRKFAREWGLKYHIIGYGEAWHKTFANLVAVGEAYYEKGRSGQDPGPAPFSMGSVHAG
jgi:fatty acid desaturase